ncbi:TRAP transporter small permease [Gelria sp. Kuro-4]|uniref:TRAP transporter small permease n=1 Tax=Gelria sp. Kuro-4 TaxID=2796927 RepID=UPI001BF0368A|nr:TRAP transporter small permease [Gelria sp. Kuro-4]BCV23561.1 hypothetical protein kuro4_03340 [Gelria sp. Kuro-4]
MDARSLFYIVDRKLTWLVQVLTVALFTGMVVLVFAQVYTRFLTNHSLTWSEELSRFLMIWMVFLASYLAFKQKSHIMVDNLVKALPGPWASAVQAAAHLAMVLFLVVLLWGAYAVLPTTALQKSPANNIVMAYVYAAIPVSALLTLLEVMRNLCAILGKGR